jgi:hypothetical protein
MKQITITPTGDGYEVCVVVDVWGRARVKRRTPCSSLTLAKSVARMLSIQNDHCPIKELPK